jgi:phosphatidate cytidylyltransferase
MKRVATAAVLIPLIVYATLWAPTWFFLLILLTVGVLCFAEYARMVAAHGIEPPRVPAYAAGIALVVIRHSETAFLTAAGCAALGLSLRFRDLSKVLPHAAAVLLGIIYIFGAWRCAALLRGMNPHWLFLALVLSWIGDTAAYYFGRSFGRRKLAPAVSPAKSVEGAAASLAASTLAGVAYLRWTIPEVAAWEAAFIAVIANIAGQLGDLCESAMKRGAGLKDSGGLLPGHGGWLDRVDSSLFAVPAVYAYLAVAASVAVRTAVP